MGTLKIKRICGFFPILPQTSPPLQAATTLSRVPWGYIELSEVSQTKERYRVLQSLLLYSPTPSKTLPFSVLPSNSN